MVLLSCRVVRARRVHCSNLEKCAIEISHIIGEIDCWLRALRLRSRQKKQCNEACLWDGDQVSLSPKYGEGRRSRLRIEYKKCCSRYGVWQHMLLTVRI